MPVYVRCGRCGKKILQGSACSCKKQSYKEYDNRVRYSKDNIKYTMFYKSKEWDSMSSYIRHKYLGLCIKCLIECDEIVPSDVVHHIDELKEDWSKRLDENNLIPLCHKCHNEFKYDYGTIEKEKLREDLKRYAQKYRQGG